MSNGNAPRYYLDWKDARLWASYVKVNPNFSAQVIKTECSPRTMYAPQTMSAL